MKKFKTGTIFGALLGAGAMWLFTTKEGKKVRGKLQISCTDVYTKVKKDIKDKGLSDTITKNAYAKMVKETVDNTLDSDFGKKAKHIVSEVVVKQFDKLKKELKK